MALRFCVLFYVTLYLLAIKRAQTHSLIVAVARDSGCSAQSLATLDLVLWTWLGLIVFP